MTQYQTMTPHPTVTPYQTMTPHPTVPHPLPVAPPSVTHGSGACGWPLPAGFNLAAAFAGSLVVAAVTRASAFPLRIDLVLVSLVVVLCSVAATWPAAWGVASLGWLFFNGFDTNHFGELHLTGLADVRPLVLLLGAAMVSAVLSRTTLRSPS